MPVEQERPDYAAMAAGLQPEFDKSSATIDGLNGQIEAIQQSLASLQNQRDAAVRAKNEVFIRQQRLREMKSAVVTREEIAAATSTLPLINAINGAGLDMIWATEKPEEFAEDMYGNDEVIFIPPHSDSRTLRILRPRDSDETGVIAALRVNSYGGTKLVLFDQGIGQFENPGVEIRVGAGMVSAKIAKYRAYSYYVGDVLTTILAQMPNDSAPKYSSFYDRERPEERLADFIGTERYQTALALLRGPAAEAPQQIAASI